MSNGATAQKQAEKGAEEVKRPAKKTAGERWSEWRAKRAAKRGEAWKRLTKLQKDEILRKLYRDLPDSAPAELRKFLEKFKEGTGLRQLKSSNVLPILTEHLNSTANREIRQSLSTVISKLRANKALNADEVMKCFSALEFKASQMSRYAPLKKSVPNLATVSNHVMAALHVEMEAREILSSARLTKFAEVTRRKVERMAQSYGAQSAKFSRNISNALYKILKGGEMTAAEKAAYDSLRPQQKKFAEAWKVYSFRHAEIIKVGEAEATGKLARVPKRLRAKQAGLAAGRGLGYVVTRPFGGYIYDAVRLFKKGERRAGAWSIGKQAALWALIGYSIYWYTQKGKVAAAKRLAYLKNQWNRNFRKMGYPNVSFTTKQIKFIVSNQFVEIFSVLGQAFVRGGLTAKGKLSKRAWYKQLEKGNPEEIVFVNPAKFSAFITHLEKTFGKTPLGKIESGIKNNFSGWKKDPPRYLKTWKDVVIDFFCDDLGLTTAQKSYLERNSGLVLEIYRNIIAGRLSRSEVKNIIKPAILDKYLRHVKGTRRIMKAEAIKRKILDGTLFYDYFMNVVSPRPTAFLPFKISPASVLNVLDQYAILYGGQYRTLFKHAVALAKSSATARENLNNFELLQNEGFLSIPSLTFINDIANGTVTAVQARKQGKLINSIYLRFDPLLFASPQLLKFAHEKQLHKWLSKKAKGGITKVKDLKKILGFLSRNYAKSSPQQLLNLLKSERGLLIRSFINKGWYHSRYRRSGLFPDPRNIVPRVGKIRRGRARKPKRKIIAIKRLTLRQFRNNVLKEILSYDVIWKGTSSVPQHNILKKPLAALVKRYGTREKAAEEILKSAMWVVNELAKPARKRSFLVKGFKLPTNMKVKRRAVLSPPDPRKEADAPIQFLKDVIEKYMLTK